MHKFWDRFVINKEELPLNSKGYIYTMCRNMWIRQKKSWNSISISETTDQFVMPDEKLETMNLDLETKKEVNDDLLKHRALAMGLEQLSEKCKKLIETELNPAIKLKDMQKDLGFTNYQAVVQAKYNCKKKLVQKVSEIIIDLKTNNSLNR